MQNRTMNKIKINKSNELPDSGFEVWLPKDPALQYSLPKFTARKCREKEYFYPWWENEQWLWSF